jgi:hypothetical protein
MFNIGLVFPLRSCLVALLLVVSAAALGQERTLDPVDEAAKDPSWVNFKNRLLNAVAKRDRKFVASILHHGVRSGMQGGRGSPSSESSGSSIRKLARYGRSWAPHCSSAAPGRSARKRPPNCARRTSR